MRTSPPPAKRRILLIEDDAAIREAIAVRLRRAGLSVFFAPDAHAAVARLARRRFDAVAGSRGVQQELHAHWPGAFAVIDRPVDFEDLVRVLDTVTARTSQAVDLRRLRRFVASVPSLRDAFDVPALSARELLLHAEIRRTILALSGALEGAAEGEPDRARAALFVAASEVAADLAAAPVRAGGH